jgi:hypothetical protein
MISVTTKVKSDGVGIGTSPGRRRLHPSKRIAAEKYNTRERRPPTAARPKTFVPDTWVVSGPIGFLWKADPECSAIEVQL